MGSVQMDAMNFANAVLQKSIQAQGTTMLALLDVMRKAEAIIGAPLGGFISAGQIDTYA